MVKGLDDILVGCVTAVSADVVWLQPSMFAFDDGVSYGDIEC